MRKDSVVFGIAGIFFGILVGWIIGSQQAAPAPQPAAATATANAAPAQTAPALDESRAATLRSAAERDPRDAEARIELGNLYFDSERFEDAVKWYEQAVQVAPQNVNASTDLGISYYYTNQPDRALAQFERSLAIDPNHSKTLLNVGIVRALRQAGSRGRREGVPAGPRRCSGIAGGKRGPAGARRPARRASERPGRHTQAAGLL